MQKLTLLQRGAVQLCCLPSRQPQMWQGADSLKLISKSQCGRNHCLIFYSATEVHIVLEKVKACLAGQTQEHSRYPLQLQSPKARCRSAALINTPSATTTALSQAVSPTHGAFKSTCSPPRLNPRSHPAL